MPPRKERSIKFLDMENNINEELKGGLKPKDDPDKLNKEDFKEKEDEDEDDEDEEKNEDEEEKENSDDDDDDEDEEDKEADEQGESGEYDECIYGLTRPSKKRNAPGIDIEVEDNFEDDDNNEREINDRYVKPSERKTKRYLFEFERVRIIGERARQLSLGAKPMIKGIDMMDPRTISKLELEKKIIPLSILRELPNGLIEKWKVSELNFF